MNAEEAANLIRVWAATNGLISRDKFLQDVEETARNADFNALSQMTDQSVEVLHRRGIQYVAFNSVNNEVIVYTKGRLNKKEKQLLPTEIADDVTVIFKQGGLANVGPHLGPPIGASPYTLHQNRYSCGSSVNPANAIGAGTMGCLVQDPAGVLYGLSNNHVTGGCNFCVPETPILAPGPFDAMPGNHDPFTIGHHERVLPMVDGIPQVVQVAGNTDAALFRIRDRNLVTSMQRAHFDTPAQVSRPAPNMAVKKVGRTSDLTRGVVRGQVSGAEPIVYYVPALNGGMKIVFYVDMFIVQANNGAFSESGDSGSLVIGTENGVDSAVGIVVGANTASNVTFILPLPEILRGFGVTLVSGLNV